ETASGGSKLGHPGLPLTWFDLLAGIVLPIACLVADYSLLAGIVRFPPIGLPSFAALGMAGFLFSGKVSMTTPVRDLILGAIIGASIVLTCLAALLLVFAYVMFRVAVHAIFDDASSTPISLVLAMFGMAALGVSPIFTAFVYLRRALKLVVIDRHPRWLW